MRLAYTGATIPIIDEPGTAIDAVLSLWLGESHRGQLLQRVRSGPGRHLRRVRSEQPARQPVLRCVR